MKCKDRFGSVLNMLERFIVLPEERLYVILDFDLSKYGILYSEQDVWCCIVGALKWPPRSLKSQI